MPLTASGRVINLFADRSKKANQIRDKKVIGRNKSTKTTAATEHTQSFEHTNICNVAQVKRRRSRGKHRQLAPCQHQKACLLCLLEELLNRNAEGACTVLTVRHDRRAKKSNNPNCKSQTQRWLGRRRSKSYDNSFTLSADKPSNRCPKVNVCMKLPEESQPSSQHVTGILRPQVPTTPQRPSGRSSGRRVIHQLSRLSLFQLIYISLPNLGARSKGGVCGTSGTWCEEHRSRFFFKVAAHLHEHSHTCSLAGRHLHLAT